jgi:N-acetylneuraminate synthase
MFIIAEIGINHNGNLDIAKQLIDVAASAGANAVKFQKRTLDKVYSKELLDSPRESPWGKTQRAQKEGLEFGLPQYREIDTYCASKNIEWFASAWDIDSQKFLRGFDLKHNKIASAMIVYEDLLEEVASERKHTFISTGMSTTREVDRAVEIFRAARCPFELMHCVSTYPMNDGDANLRRIATLRERYKCDVGYSGHEVGLTISYAAAAMGITSLERHITLDRAMYGSDQAASVEPDGFRKLVRAIRTIETAMGDGAIDIQEQEVPVAVKLRSHIPWQASQR